MDQLKTFTYRQFVKLISLFSARGQAELALAKLFKSTQDRKLSWKQIFGQFNQKHNKSSKKQDEIPLKHLRQLIIDYKLGISTDEMDLITNCFDQERITSAHFEKRLHDSAEKLESSEKTKSSQILSLLRAIQEKLDLEQIDLDRLFFQHDTDKSGRLTLLEFTHMLEFLEIKSDKLLNKLLFSKLD